MFGELFDLVVLDQCNDQLCVSTCSLDSVLIILCTIALNPPSIHSLRHCRSINLVVCMHVCIYVCMYVCMYVYMYETISYYVSSSSVYSVFLDETKAFDRVDYCKLFDALLNRNLFPVIVRLPLNMFFCHVTCIMWNGVFHISSRIDVFVFCGIHVWDALCVVC